MPLVKQICNICGQEFGQINCNLAKEDETTGGYCQDCFEQNLRRFNLASSQNKPKEREEEDSGSS